MNLLGFLVEFRNIERTAGHAIWQPMQCSCWWNRAMPLEYWTIAPRRARAQTSRIGAVHALNPCASTSSGRHRCRRARPKRIRL